MNDNEVNQKVVINKSWCKNCSICEEFCPRKVFKKNDKGDVAVVNPEDCTLCGMCQLRCPDFAIALREDNGE